jgi:hypothetical protein
VLDAAVKLMDQADQRGTGQASTCDTRVAFAHAVSAAPCPMHACRNPGTHAEGPSNVLSELL